MICKACGKEFTGRTYPDGMCQGCYNYFRKGGEVYPIPDKGNIERTADGKVICHICGRAYTRLGSHLKESHNMTIARYKEIYGICNNAKTTELSYSEHMAKLSIETGKTEKLMEAGVKTRIKKGKNNSLRQGKSSRLQECMERSKRMTGKKRGEYKK